ncbi:MAG: hypothetical protein KCHDKBKB_02796 [Elusimicrobia bacterium]|nr:hypothetical protein [Elusimicrobiota bacterium]
MFHLRKKRPPFGTEESPLWEHAYSEEVKVVEGICHVEYETTRDYLLKNGYEEIETEETELVPSLNGSDHAEPVPRTPKPKPKKKHRR